MARNTSVYWKSEKIAGQARQMATAKEISVSQLISDLVSSAYTANFEPPIRAECPSCHTASTFVFLALWDGLTEQQEPVKLYRCGHCQTTVGESDLGHNPES